MPPPPEEVPRFRGSSANAVQPSAPASNIMQPNATDPADAAAQSQHPGTSSWAPLAMQLPDVPEVAPASNSAILAMEVPPRGNPLTLLQRPHVPAATTAANTIPLAEGAPLSDLGGLPSLTSGQAPSHTAGGISASVGGLPTLTPEQQRMIDENRRAAWERRREREQRGNQDEPQQTQNQAGATPAVGAQDLKCPICLEDLGSGQEDEITALPCAHPFHTSCINTYMESTGKTFETACPFKCHRSLVSISAEEEMDLTARGPDDVMDAADPEDMQAAANALADTAREFLGQ